MEKESPKTTQKIKLTPGEIEQARERARKAGRRYPNLIDNMAIAKLKNARKELP